MPYLRELREKVDKNGLVAKFFYAASPSLSRDVFSKNMQKIIDSYYANFAWTCAECDEIINHHAHLWGIYLSATVSDLYVDDTEFEIMSYFLDDPAIDRKIGDTHYLYFGNESYIYTLDYNEYSNVYLMNDELIEQFIEGQLDELIEIWQREERGEIITNPEYLLAVELGFKVERLFDGYSQVLVYIPTSDTKYNYCYYELDPLLRL